MKTLKLIAAVGLTTVCGIAAAAPTCTKEPQSKWLPETEMKAKIAAMGYTIDRFLVSGSCYEIYGRNKAGKKAEVYFNPVDAKIVKERLG